MTPEEFPGELGASYQEACGLIGVPPRDGGYGLVLGQDESGACWTQVSTDLSGITTARSVWAMGLESGYQAPPGTVTATVPGWPVPCTLAVAGLPDPHDPPGTRAAPDQAGPGSRQARRRALADQLVSELADSGHQDAAQHAEAQQWHALNMGDTEVSPVLPRLIDLRVRATPGYPGRPAADRAISQAWQLAATATPPPGTVRVRTAWPAARVVRASGDGWTLTARGGDQPLLILLLDDVPGIILDISDTSQAAELIDALTAAATRAPTH